MQVQTSRFGLVDSEEKDVFIFAQGLLGFEEFKRFAILPVNENQAFCWLQSLDEETLAFLLADPFTFVSDYELDLTEEILRQLEIAKQEEVMVYTIVSVPKSGLRDATINLVGPLIFNLRSKKALQHVLENSRFQVKYPLFLKTPARANAGR